MTNYKENYLDLLKEAELELDFHNSEYGTKEKYCLCCGSDSYDGIIGIKHYPHCVIKRIRDKLINDKPQKNENIK